VKISSFLSRQKIKDLLAREPTRTAYLSPEDREFLLKGKFLLINDCFLVGYTEHPIAPSNPKGEHYCLVKTLEFKGSELIYARTKLKLIKQMIGKHLKGRQIFSYVDINDIKANKFNALLFNKIDKRKVGGKDCWLYKL
jgi:hypothetical protein